MEGSRNLRGRTLALAAWLALGAAACRHEPRVISGRVEARRVAVAAEVAARIVKLAVREGDRVTSGQILAELDDSLVRAQRDEARAQLGEASARLDELKAGARAQEIADAQALVASAQAELALAHKGARDEQIAQLQAAIAGSEARIILARSTKNRVSGLGEDGAIAEAEIDQATAELDTATAERARLDAQLAEARAGARPEQITMLEARLAQSEAHLSLLREGARAEQIAAAVARVAAATSALAAAEETLRRCQLIAPCAGEIEIVDFEQGELAPLGAPVIAIARDGPLRARVYAPQSALASLKPDDQVSIYVDGYPDRPIATRVERIWDEAEFTASNVQTPDDRMLLLFRVDLEVAPSDDPPVRPGTNVVVSFEPTPRR